MKVMIVRRTPDSACYFFLKTFAKANGLELIVDRRVGDRRQRREPRFGDRRASDRRGAPPQTWAEGDFIVIEDRPQQRPDENAQLATPEGQPDTRKSIARLD